MKKILLLLTSIISIQNSFANAGEEIKFPSFDFATYKCSAKLLINGKEVSTLNSGNASSRMPVGLIKKQNTFEIIVSEVTMKEGSTNYTPSVNLRFYAYKGEAIVFYTKKLEFNPKAITKFTGQFQPHSNKSLQRKF